MLGNHSLFGGYEGMGVNGVASFVENGTQLQLRVKALPACKSHKYSKMLLVQPFLTGIDLVWITALNGSGNSLDISSYSYIAFSVQLPSVTATFSVGLTFNNRNSMVDKNSTADVYVDISAYKYYTSDLNYDIYVPIFMLTTDANALSVAKEIAFGNFNQAAIFKVWNVRLACGVESVSLSKRDGNDTENVYSNDMTMNMPEPAITPPPPTLSSIPEHDAFSMLGYKVMLHGRAKVANAITTTVWVTATTNLAGITNTVTVTKACATPIGGQQQLVTSLCVPRKMDPNPSSSSTNLVGGAEVISGSGVASIVSGALSLSFGYVNACKSNSYLPWTLANILISLSGEC